MVNINIGNENPKSWDDVRIIVLGDSHIGNLSFKDIPADERPKLRARSLKGAKLHRLLPMVDTEITEYKPHIVVVSVGQNDLTHVGSQHFPEADHQHHVRKISYDFDIKIAATEIFQCWHNWLSKYSCKVLFALTYPLDLQEINNRRLKNCSECQQCYSGEELREILWERIQDWGDLLKEQDVPVMHLDDVLEKINPGYKESDAAIEESERALVDGIKPNVKFGECLFTVIREVCEQIWPDFLGFKEIKREDASPYQETSQIEIPEEDASLSLESFPMKMTDDDDVSQSPETFLKIKTEENGNDHTLSVPPKKKPKIRF